MLRVSTEPVTPSKSCQVVHRRSSSRSASSSSIRCFDSIILNSRPTNSLFIRCWSRCAYRRRVPPKRPGLSRSAPEGEQWIKAFGSEHRTAGGPGRRRVARAGLTVGRALGGGTPSERRHGAWGMGRGGMGRGGMVANQEKTGGSGAGNKDSEMCTLFRQNGIKARSFDQYARQ